jgi:hypothetical protein
MKKQKNSQQIAVAVERRYRLVARGNGVVVVVSRPVINEGISAPGLWRRVAALVPDMKNHKIANNSATTEAREKITTYLESLEFQKIFY